MHFALLLLMAAPLPPSSTLSGSDGTLSWVVTADGEEVRLDGRSPKWTVSHWATPELTPLRTRRTDEDGATVEVAYSDTGAVVKLPKKTVTIDQPGLWDGDTLDVRLGALVARGTTDLDFAALDVANAKVYDFQARLQGQETCGSSPCSHIRVTLTGILKAVGPKWHFWFGADGQMLKFEGPIGTFAVEG